MSNSNDGALGLLIFIGTIAISIGSGVMAWNWVDPESFMGAIGFLIVWGFFSYIGHMIVAAIVAALASSK